MAATLKATFMIAAICLADFCTGLTSPAKAEININHQITKDYFNDIANRVLEDEPIVVTVIGGWSEPSMDLAELLHQRSDEIQFPGLCFSACAEYLLPSARHARTGKSTLVAYHQNPLIIDFLARKHIRKDKQSCLPDRTSRTSALLNEFGVSADFWKKVLDTLEFERIDGTDDPCAGFTISFKNSWWIPTSEQLRKLAGLNIDGNICNDDLACVTAFAGFLIKPGQRIVVGDEVFQMTETGQLHSVAAPPLRGR